jgi:hypothetical protein
MRLLAGLLVLLLGLASHGSAATLEVGPNRPLTLPSQAARIAQDGDTIAIDAGDYIDCAVWTRRNLLIEGKGRGAVIRRRVCNDKGVFVTVGDHITLRNLTFADARAPSHNGAGLRAEGRYLMVQNCRFLDNENGILSAPAPDSTILITHSEFRGNGTCESACAHAIYAGEIGLLRVEHSRFSGTHQGHAIKSRARRTEVIDNVIEDGPDGSSSYLIDIPNGGATLIQGNRMAKGPHSDNPGTAISIGAEGVSNPTPWLVVRNNRFINRQAVRTVFVRNFTGTEALLTGNVLRGGVTPLDGPGSVR